MSKNYLVVIPLLMILSACSRLPGASYEVVEREEQDVLVVTDTQTGRKFDGPANQIVKIENLVDFDADGVDDALVSSSTGGNCCPPEYSVITIKNNQIKKVDLDYDWNDVSVIDESNKYLISVKSIKNTIIYRFNGEKLLTERVIPQLPALKEVMGPGGQSLEDRKPQVLEFDIDEDGEDEVINCPVWERWGSLLCVVPVRGSEPQELSIGCDRFGVLASVNNGYHEFVCNNDLIITFDGKKWTEKTGKRDAQY